MDWLEKTLGSNAASLARAFSMHGNHFFCIFSGFHYRWITRRRSYYIDCFFLSRLCNKRHDTAKRKKAEPKIGSRKLCTVCAAFGNCRSCGTPNKSNYPLFSVNFVRFFVVVVARVSDSLSARTTGPWCLVCSVHCVFCRAACWLIRSFRSHDNNNNLK